MDDHAELPADVNRVMDLIEEKLCIVWTPHKREQFVELLRAALRAQPAGVKGDAEAARDAIRELASVKMDLSLEDWCRISNTILSALEPAALSKQGGEPTRSALASTGGTDAE